MRRCFLIPPAALLAAFLFFPGGAAAQAGGRIQGKILARDGQALAGAVVTIFKEDRNGGIIQYTRTDGRGEYRFRDLAPGQYSLQVNHQGYRPLVKPMLSVTQGKTLTLNVFLLEILDWVSSDDPRNWGVATLMRSTSDRRLIFRNTDDADAGRTEAAAGYGRSGAVTLSSSSELGGDYSVYPSGGFAGVVSNFAYSEPIARNGRMILAGQLSAGYDTRWKVRNTFQFRPQTGGDLELTLGYGRQNLASTTLGTMAGPARFFALDPALRDTGVETLNVAFTGRDQMLDTFAIEYGFDLSQVRRGSSRKAFSPHFQLVAAPSRGWMLRSMVASKRISEANSIVLPDGEFINLMEPVYITEINGVLSVSQFKHAELGVERAVGANSSLELSLYEDRMTGPGMPVAWRIEAPGQSRKTRLAQLREEQTEQRGARIAARQRFLDTLTGSIGYVYAAGYGLDATAAPAAASPDSLAGWIQGGHFHSFTGSVHAKVPLTRTDLRATLRWHTGYPATPIDWFADRMDSEGKGFALFVRQIIPLPEFLYGAGQWVALVDVRNLFDQGKYIIPTREGFLILTPAPRYVRFGLNLNFN